MELSCHASLFNPNARDGFRAVHSNISPFPHTAGWIHSSGLPTHPTKPLLNQQKKTWNTVAYSKESACNKEHLKS